MNYLWDNIFRNRRKEDDVLAALRGNILFRDLTEREIRFLEGVVHLRRYHTGESVFRKGEIGVGMYIIVRGRIEIFLTDEASPTVENRDVFITQLGAGDFFGELSLVEENGRRTANAIAREDTFLIGFFRPDLDEILKRGPGAGLKILLRLSEVLGRRLKETTDKVSDLRRALKDMREPPPTDGKRDGSQAPSAS